MRITRLLTLVVLISFVFLLMFLDMNGSYKYMAKAAGNNIKPSLPAAMVQLK